MVFKIEIQATSSDSVVFTDILEVEAANREDAESLVHDLVAIDVRNLPEQVRYLGRSLPRRMSRQMLTRLQRRDSEPIEVTDFKTCLNGSLAEFLRSQSPIIEVLDEEKQAHLNIDCFIPMTPTQLTVYAGSPFGVNSVELSVLAVKRVGKQ